VDELSLLGENINVQPIPITVNAVSDGEDLQNDVPEGEEVLRASEFHPPLASTKDYLAVPTKKKPPAYCLPVNTPLCDWNYFGACPTGSYLNLVRWTAPTAISMHIAFVWIHGKQATGCLSIPTAIFVRGTTQ
jgi:hypothetical protein